MQYVYEDLALGAFFGLSTDYLRDAKAWSRYSDLLFIHWNRTEEKACIQVDGVDYWVDSQELTTTNYLQYVGFPEAHTWTTLAFNRPFYCILDHDHEVACSGLLFLGTQAPPIVQLDEAEQRKFSILLEVFLDEFGTHDQIQGEMLRMLLKRFIIKTTRLAKTQLLAQDLNNEQIDLIRRFNVLVDLHFKEKHQVQEYAAMLYKSPKTLSNVFARQYKKTPLQVIRARLVLETKRLLLYSDKTVREIAAHIGFDTDSALHRIFKKETGLTPKQFKQQQEKEKKIALREK